MVSQCSAATAPRVKTAADSSEAGVEDLALRSRVRSSSRPPAAHAGDPTHDEHRTGHNPRPEDPGIPVDLQSSGGRVQCTLTDHGNGYDPPSPATSRSRTRARPAPGWLAGHTAELQDPRPAYLPYVAGRGTRVGGDPTALLLGEHLPRRRVAVRVVSLEGRTGRGEP